jgi:hypothetical protein
MKNRSIKAFYPILLGIYPAIALITENLSQMRFQDGVRALLFAIIFSFVIYTGFRLLIKDESKASLMCACFFLFFFAYGHVYDALEGWGVSGFVIGRHRFLFPIWLFVFGIGAWWLFKHIRRFESTNRLFNIISVVLLIIPIVRIGVFESRRSNSTFAGNIIVPSDSIQPLPSVGNLPDVYYIILDSYSRQDILLQYYDLDISDFVNRLETMGFYVVPCSQSNYAVTDLSLTTSLNLNYIQDVIPVDVENQTGWISLGEPIRHSLVRQMLTGLGYKTVAFETGVWWSEIQDADYFFKKSNQGIGFTSNFWQPNEFEVLFIRTTILRLVDEMGKAWLGEFFQAPERGHAEYILYTLNQMQIVPEIPGSKFVFLHLMAPHAPYVFNPEGDFVVSESADPGFPNEIAYLNSQLIPLVQTIITKSSKPPIIILQSDHGLDTEVRLANFIAIYFPQGGNSVLYPTLTPVNIFRLMFNVYFGQNFSLLPDASFQSDYGDYYNFTEVTYPCNP